MTTAAALVGGLGALGVAVVDRLQGAGVAVTVVTDATEAESWELEARGRGVRLITGTVASASLLTAAGIGSVSALVLTAADDARNVDATLTARRLRADLPIVVRIFDDQVGRYLRDTVPGVTVISTSAIAAPAFADAALRAVGRVSAASALPLLSRGPRPLAAAPIDRIVALIALASGLLIGVSTLYFSHALGLTWLDALYFVWTTVFTVGYGDITPRHGPAFAKLAAMGLMLAGATLVAVAYALLAGWVVERRIALLRGHVAVRGGGHVIVAGAGHVGVRVTERLRDRGHRTVVVERDPQCAHIDRLRAGGCQVIVADAASPASLDLAGIDRAIALLALTDSDASNLRIALASHERRPNLLVVARLASPELSAHVTAHGDAIALSSVALASAAFAEAALAAVRGAGRAAPLVPGGAVD